jgi:Na+-transporting NADH:ubiquinone oxidoreductase subunit A
MNILIKKGLDLNIVGEIADSAVASLSVKQAAVVPDDFPGFIPKADVKPGDHVLVGQALAHDKNHPDVKIVAPVSGTVADVVRGERRKIERIVVDSDSKMEHVKFDVAAPGDSASLIRLLAESGLLAKMTQRPYGIVPNPDVRPRDIFITCFDSSPLAVDRQFADGDKKYFAAAVKALKQLTDGSVYLCQRAGQGFDNIADAETANVAGPHPAGIVGFQIAAIAPINKGEIVWTLDADTLYKIGRLMVDAIVDTSVVVAVVGGAVSQRGLVTTIEGAPVSDIIAGRLDSADYHKRIISGNVLTGEKVEADGFIHCPYRQITVIPEGDDVDEFMGWASLSTKKMSISPTFFGRMMHRVFNPDARVLGGRRAMIMSGLYEKVFPMDIMVEYLIKAINARDIDAMEKLGAYEVIPEDFALAECIDSSKLPLQQIVREGLEFLRKEVD